MRKEELHEKIQQLIKEVSNIKSSELKHKMEQLKESLSDLRIALKYLLLDLEATRRERDEFKKMLDLDNDEPDIDEGNL